nr:MAG TPA: hypothetical protein [Caudoviricetes sp.]DAR19092.1 MAG TPA: hypothetical protein [Caudoviricetes sp.]DAS57943.1 MAG TPA: hypothetical protein [Caudoviricetes sp.]
MAVNKSSLLGRTKHQQRSCGLELWRGPQPLNQAHGKPDPTRSIPGLSRVYMLLLAA